ncbi:MAG: hypothetical protein ACRCXT_15125 [Paraclostridium sp.]
MNTFKETIIIYGVIKEDIIEVYVTNTAVGKNNKIEEVKSLEEIEFIINNLIQEEANIKNQKDLFTIEKYILKNKWV